MFLKVTLIQYTCNLQNDILTNGMDIQYLVIDRRFYESKVNAEIPNFECRNDNFQTPSQCMRCDLEIMFPTDKYIVLHLESNLCHSTDMFVYSCIRKFMFVYIWSHIPCTWALVEECWYFSLWTHISGIHISPIWYPVSR